MNEMRKALIINGSPKLGSGASATLGVYLAGKLGAAEFQVETAHANLALRSASERDILLSAFMSASVVVLVFPLYIDSLPAGLTRLLEVLAAEERARAASPERWLLAVCQNGFPEPGHNQPALRICQLFCSQVGMQWAGGLALGGGGALAGLDLGKAGFMARNAVKALDMACADLAAGRPVAPEAIALMAKPSFPRWLYIAISHHGWRQLAKKNKVSKRLREKPYGG